MLLYDSIRQLSDEYEHRLRKQIDQRVLAMEDDDVSHYVLYQVLGIGVSEGKDIDIFQNKGRFLYKYAGSFLEEAARQCMIHKFPDAGPVALPNTIGQRPKNFGIDCLCPDGNAFEIKWRDATTDGDHITKEHTRMKVVADAGYKPMRVMFYYPNRDQAKRIQKTLETLYHGLGGEYHYGDGAWKFINDYTGVDLLAVINRIADEKVGHA
jgi:ApaLI-like restriction endonuclease